MEEGQRHGGAIKVGRTQRRWSSIMMGKVLCRFKLLKLSLMSSSTTFLAVFSINGTIPNPSTLWFRYNIDLDRRPLPLKMYCCWRQLDAYQQYLTIVNKSIYAYTINICVFNGNLCNFECSFDSNFGFLKEP